MLTFSETVDLRLSTATLVVGGRDRGDVELKEGRGATDVIATVPADVRPDETGGRWRLAFRVISRDGHPVAGDLGFAVAETASPPTNGQGSAETATASAPAEPTDTSSSSGTDPGSEDGFPWQVLPPLGVLGLVAFLLFFGFRRIGRYEDDAAS